MECDRQFFVILGYFLPFYPTNDPKNQNFDKMKKTPDDIILHRCTKDENHMMYVPEIWSATDRIFYFGPFFALLPH